jgi:hypothetical protein
MQQNPPIPCRIMAHDLKQCVCCGSTEEVETYHPDGLTVWLCDTCHEPVYPMNR